MRTIMLAIGLAAMCTTAVHAQSDKMAPMKDHHCLTMADANTWQKLGLTADQTKQVQDIQARCKKDETAMTDQKSSDAMAMHGKYEQELQKVLTPEQYTQWKDWCGKQPASSRSSTKSEMKQGTK